MEKEVISQKQAIIIMSTFIIGSSAILGSGVEAKHDIWLSIFIAVAMAGLIYVVYGRIAKLFPEKDIFAILDFLFGKVFGKIITFIYIWYAFYLASLVVRNFSEFVQIVSLPETPKEVFAFLMIFLPICTVRGGIELLGRFLGIFFPVFILAVFLITFLSIPLYDFTHLKPFLYEGFTPVLKSSFSIFSFPFAETVFFLALAGSFRKNSSPYRIYYTSLLIGGFLLMMISVRSLLVLGAPNMLIQNFPSYASTRLIKIGSFFQRVESSVAISFMITGFTKTTFCLYAATKGLSHLFKIKDYHKLAAPVGVLVALFSIIVYKDASQMFYWGLNIYGYYNIPIQIIIPIIVWITAEIKTRTLKNKSTSKNEIESSGNAI